jgi:hypothetical protein
MKTLLAVLVVWVATISLSAVLAFPAAANTPLYGFDVTTTSSQAGGHPDVATRFEVGTWGTEGALPCLCNDVRDVTVNTPAGLVANPGNTPRCKLAEFPECPVDSQIGVTSIRLFAPLEQSGAYYFVPLYSMEPKSGQLALWASPAPLLVPTVPIYTVISSRTESDYGIEFKTVGLSRIVPPNEVTLLNWGVPADPDHDPLRFPHDAVKFTYCPGGNPNSELLAGTFPTDICNQPHPPVPSNAPAAPYVINPTTCGAALTSHIDTVGYDHSEEHADSPFPAITGCDQLGFEPSLSAKPTTTSADSPSGIDVTLTVPQTLSPTSPTASAIREVKTEFPSGFTINPNAAAGKSSCSDEAARFGTRDEAQCPEFAKIGSLEVDSASFPASLPGAIYLGEPLPGNRYRVFLVADGFSLHVKLPGTATPDPQTGQLMMSFKNLPQFTFQAFKLHFFGAERGLLATPTHCGTYAVKSEFVPWATALPTQTSTQFFTIDSGPSGAPCPGDQRPFSPSLRAGVSDNTGGAHSPFSLQLTRSDGDQTLAGLSVVTPPGFSASLRGVTYCPESAIAQLTGGSYHSGLTELASPSCPATSQVGTVDAAAGAGSRPVHVSGRVYLAGPYKGAPLSFLVLIPAVSGPYDLGVVAIRAAIHVDPSTAQVTAITDPLPQIIEGIPLRARSIQIDLNRPGFALNPTNCDPFSIVATVLGDQGAGVNLNPHFQVANCEGLSYGPRMKLELSGGLGRRGHPSIHAIFRAQLGEANTRAVTVTLPKGELLDNSHIGTVCTRVAFAARNCPPASRIGRAEVSTPLLDRPLSGFAYLRSSARDLPDIAIDLRGQIDVVLLGHVDSVNARLRTSFEPVPDVPVSSFALDLAGGRKGLLQNSESLCGAHKKATARMAAQNGALLTSRVPLRTSCKTGGRGR